MNNKELTERVEDIKKKYIHYSTSIGDSNIFYMSEDDYRSFERELTDLLAKAILSNDEIKREAVEHCVNELSGKPKCTEEEPCGCHFGEVFHSDGMCACDLVKKILGDLTQKENNE